MRTFFLLLALFSIPLAYAQRPENPFHLDVQVGAMLIGHDVFERAFSDPNRMPGFKYDRNAVWQTGLKGSYLLSPRLGLQGKVSYAGFRSQPNSSYLYQVIDTFTAYHAYTNMERPFQSLALSFNTCVALAFLGKNRYPLWLQAGGTLRRQWVSAGQTEKSSGYAELNGETYEEEVVYTWIPYTIYGDTTLLTLRRITPAVHLGLSLEGLLNDRLSCYVAIDKDLLAYRQGVMGFVFVPPVSSGRRSEAFFRTQSFFLETLSFGMGVRLW